MDNALIAIILQLLPGFLAAWIFYGLTSYPRRDVYERIIQALIFTGIIKVITNVFRWLLIQFGHIICIGTWTGSVEYNWSMVFAVLFGFTISTIANRDIFHKFLRNPLKTNAKVEHTSSPFVKTIRQQLSKGEIGKWLLASWDRIALQNKLRFCCRWPVAFVKNLRVTSKNSFPSEWFSAFHRESRWVILHLKNGRKLRGWPEEWPNEPGQGHFLMVRTSWIPLGEGEAKEIIEVKRMIIPAESVEWIEQLTFEKERR